MNDVILSGLGILLALALDAAFTAASEYSELLQTRRV